MRSSGIGVVSYLCDKLAENIVRVQCYMFFSRQVELYLNRTIERIGKRVIKDKLRRNVWFTQGNRVRQNTIYGLHIEDRTQITMGNESIVCPAAHGVLRLRTCLYGSELIAVLPTPNSVPVLLDIKILASSEIGPGQAETLAPGNNFQVELNIWGITDRKLVSEA